MEPHSYSHTTPPPAPSQAHSPIETYFEAMVRDYASDLYLTHGLQPMMRVNDQLRPLADTALDDAAIEAVIADLLDEQRRQEFLSELELNVAYNWRDRARFRLNFFIQQQHAGLVIRRITTDIPTLDELLLPPAYSDLIMEKRGLILVVGPTGSGKSSSLAAMIGFRNLRGSGHIITIEDPIEFIHAHENCIITQREVGMDTYSYDIALKNTLRQRPDVIMIGEVRDRDTMEYAVSFAETGHLCIATLHANNANQAIERILNFFPEEKHRQLLMNLSLNLRGILSQRLVTRADGGKAVATEVMLNHGLIKQLIEEGRVKEIKEVIARHRDEGMQTFDQSLLDLYMAGTVTEEQALAESDNPTDLRLKIREAKARDREAAGGSAHLQMPSWNPGGGNHSTF